MNNDGYRSRKMWMAWFILVTATATMWFSAKIDGSTWLAVCTLCLGVYSAANVAEKRQ